MSTPDWPPSEAEQSKLRRIRCQLEAGEIVSLNDLLWLCDAFQVSIDGANHIKERLESCRAELQEYRRKAGWVAP